MGRKIHVNIVFTTLVCIIILLTGVCITNVATYPRSLNQETKKEISSIVKEFGQLLIFNEKINEYSISHSVEKNEQKNTNSNIKRILLFLFPQIRNFNFNIALLIILIGIIIEIFIEFKIILYIHESDGEKENKEIFTRLNT